MLPLGAATTSTSLPMRGLRRWPSPARRRIPTRCTARISPKKTTPRPRTRSPLCWLRRRAMAAKSIGSIAACASTSAGWAICRRDAPRVARRFPGVCRRLRQHARDPDEVRQPMAKKSLNIVESAYRAVIEEQDDTILWLVAAMQAAGGNHSVVLRGNAVNYALAGQGAPALTVGEWQQTQAPKMDRDVADLADNRNVAVYVVEEDLGERGIAVDQLVPNVRLVSRRALPQLFAEHEVICHW